jgi:molecular chaperone GrpE (heat shock protein)
MLNFEAELEKLLSRETGALPRYEFAELAAAGREILAELNKKQNDVSLQIEEIYDLVKEQEELRQAAKAEQSRANQLVLAAVGLCDLLEDFCAYAKRGGGEEFVRQAELLWETSGGILAAREVLRFGEEGQSLDPRIHTVQASAESPLPREQVVEVLRSGYAYRGALVRKAVVVVSRGQEEAEREPDNGEAPDYDEDMYDGNGVNTGITEEAEPENEEAQATVSRNGEEAWRQTDAGETGDYDTNNETENTDDGTETQNQNEGEWNA